MRQHQWIRRERTSYNPGQDLSPLNKVLTIRIAELAKSAMHITDTASSKFRDSFVVDIRLMQVDSKPR